MGNTNHIMRTYCKSVTKLFCKFQPVVMVLHTVLT